jgi:hypothetical protein
VHLGGGGGSWIPVVQFPTETKIFLFATVSGPALSVGVKWLGHEADHSFSSSAEVPYTSSQCFA